jgi:SAM-dependent methyltransferase
MSITHLFDPVESIMAAEHRTTSEINGQFWGARAKDWAEVQESTCRAVYLATFSRVGLDAGTVYLDVGCGAGMATQIAAEKGAHVFGLDASPNLLEIARGRVPGGEFHLGDLENLPFANNTFDLVTGFNSFQYAGNPADALGEAKRVAKPNAHVVIMTWSTPEGMEAASLVSALRPLLPPPPAGAAGPFALSDEAALRAFAAEAGLEPLEVFDVDSPWQYPDLSIALRGLTSSGNAVRAIATVGEGRVKEAYAKALARFEQPNGSYRIGASFRCLVTRA